jgi:hypothetical protein
MTNIKDFKLGPTGDYPHGKLRPDDEGGLNCAIAVDKNGMVFIDFGKAVNWLALPKEEAIELAKILLTKAGIKKITLEL